MPNLIKHSAAGAIIKKDDKILMLDRNHIPLGWACPAGHIEAGEAAAETMIREIKEETNLDVKKYKLLIHEAVDFGTCGRGFTGHDWYVYEALDWQGEIKLSSEHKDIGWKTIEEIKTMRAEKRLEEIWEYFFKKLNLI